MAVLTVRMEGGAMTIDKEKLKALVERVKTDRRFCADDDHHALAEGVLALLAEIERLEKCLFMESAELSWSDSDGRAIQAARDQLKAENEALLQSKDRAMSLLDQLETQNAELKAALKPLERDAERYRWLRRQPNDCSAPRIDICHWARNGDDSVNEGEGLRGPQADEAIDAAMAKEASHG